MSFKVGDIIHTTESSDLILKIIKISDNYNYNYTYTVRCLRATNYRTRIWNAGDIASIGKSAIENQCELDKDYILDRKLECLNETKV